jgi:phosphohistidine phosphatase SixA
MLAKSIGVAVASEKARFPAWVYRQSAVLPYRRRYGDLEVLLITSRGKGRWILPKGIVEPGLTAAESAAKEALEEAGVEGIMADAPLGSYRYEKWGGICDVDVYPLLVSDELADWPESGVRRRRWLPVPEAAQEVEVEGLGEIIGRLPDVAKPSDDTTAGNPHQPGPVRLVYLFRHAEAEPGGPDVEDVDRPLTARGASDARRMQRYVRLADAQPDLVLCSAALRARQTLDAVQPMLGEQAAVRYGHDLYQADAEAILGHLRQVDPEALRVMIVGHNPAVRELAARLAGPAVAASRLDRFPAGSFAILLFRGESWSDLADASCELHSVVGPADIEDDPKRPRE